MKLTLLVAALPAASAVPTWPWAHGKPLKYPGLDVLAKRAGLLYFGTAIDNVVLNNPTYISIAHNRSEFGQVTPSNGQKWMYIEPSRNVFNYTLGDQITVPAKRNGQLRRCHNFVWHNQLPGWVTGRNWTKPELVKVLENHIKNEARHYYWDCYAWDVVNEAFEDDGVASLRKSIWLEVIGKEYLELAFKFARKYTRPGTKLYYNDYAIERIGNKSLAVAALVKDFKKRGVPIDGVGLQAHYTVGRAPTYDDQKATLNMFRKLGMETALTELDVRIQLPDNATAQALQGEVYANSTKACVDVKGCVGVTVWDFWDPVSWVPDTFPGYGNADIWDV
ncbi:glycoside hydrolase, partial [Bimuria novae-zelandiae CBS 107.79]